MNAFEDSSIGFETTPRLPEKESKSCSLSLEIEEAKQNQKLLFGSENDSKNSSVEESEILARDTFDDSAQTNKNPLSDPTSDKIETEKSDNNHLENKIDRKSPIRQRIINASPNDSSPDLEEGSAMMKNEKSDKNSQGSFTRINTPEVSKSNKSSEILAEAENLNETAKKALQNMKQLQIKVPRLKPTKKVKKLRMSSDSDSILNQPFLKKTKIDINTAPSPKEIDSFEFIENEKDQSHVSISSNDEKSPPKRGRRKTRY